MPEQLLALPTRGLATTPDPLMIADGKSPDLQNVRFRHEDIRKRFGWSWFDQAADPKAYGRNFIQASYSGADDVGVTEQFLMLRGQTLYNWDVTTSTWVPATIAGVDLHLPTATERFGVCNTLDAVFAVSWNSRIRKWDGTTYDYLLHDLGLDETGAGTRTALSGLTCIAFNNRVVLVRTREGGIGLQNQHPARIRWCANGQPTKWNPANTEGCGVLDVIESSEKPLSGAFVVNGRAFLTREHEILELIATGGLDPVFRVESRISGLGMIAPHSWALADGFGFFLGHDNVYSFDGSQPKPIGSDVIEEILQCMPYDNILTGKTQGVLGAHFSRTNEYWLFVDGGDDAPAEAATRVWIYDYRSDRWYRDQLPYKIGAFGPFYPTEIPGAADAPGQMAPAMVLSADPTDPMDPLAAGAGTWFLDKARDSADEGFTHEDLPIDAFVALKDQYGMVVRQSAAGSAGVPQLNKMNTAKCIAFQAPPGQRVTVGVSADRGETWTEREVLTRPGGVGFAWFTVPYAQLRIRLRNADNKPMTLRGVVSYQWKQAGVLLSSG